MLVLSGCAKPVSYLVLDSGIGLDWKSVVE